MEVKVIGQMDNTIDHTFESANRVYDVGGCSPTINTCGGGGLQPKILDKQIVAMRGRNPDNPSDRTVGAPTEQRLELNSQGICNTLTSVQKDNMVLENLYDFYNNNLKSDGICGTITGACSHNGSGTFGVVEPQYRIRKLTPLECWFLMSFSIEDFLAAKMGNREIAECILAKYPHRGKRMFTEVQRIEKMSNTQMYKQAGNSIVKILLMAIFGQMIHGKENVYKELGGQNGTINRTF